MIRFSHFFWLILTFCMLTRGEKPPIAEGAWTIAVIPDTQYYTRKDQNAPIFSEMTEWLAANRETRNIKLVLHVGDIVDDNQDRQWTHAKKSMQVLDGKLPYVLAVGNHDLGVNAQSRETMLNQYFNIEDNPLNEKMLGGVFREGELENAWYRFEHEGWEAIIFSLEFGPRKAVVDWANEVASKHPDTPLILLTHDFIDQESTLHSSDGLPRRSTPKTKNSPHQYGISKLDRIYCGEELWEAFVSKFPNVILVLNGHYKTFGRVGEKGNQKIRHVRDLTAAYRMDPRGEGRVTHQMLFNAQWAPRGGNGWLRLLEIQPDGRTVQVKTFSPYLARTAKNPSKAWRRGPGYEFTFMWKNTEAQADSESEE